MEGAVSDSVESSRECEAAGRAEVGMRCCGLWEGRRGRKPSRGQVGIVL